MSSKRSNKPDTGTKFSATSIPATDPSSAAEMDARRVYADGIDKAIKLIESEPYWISRTCGFAWDSDLKYSGTPDHPGRYKKSIRATAAHTLGYFHGELEQASIADAQQWAETHGAGWGLTLAATDEDWDHQTKRAIKKYFSMPSKVSGDTQQHIAVLDTCRLALKTANPTADYSGFPSIDRIFDGWCYEGPPDHVQERRKIMSSEFWRKMENRSPVTED